MRFKKTNIAGVWVIDPTPHKDERGRFMRAWCAQEFAEQGINFLPVQANIGFSIKKGTVRGMHFQKAPAPEAKLVRCTRGAIFDVAVDVRPKSPTCGKWYGVELNPDNGRMLFIPEFCAHGYQTLKRNTEIFYLTSGYYSPNLSTGIRFDDPAISIKWPIATTIMSEQDRNWPLLERKEVEK